MHHIIGKHCSFICCHSSYYWQTLFLHMLSCIISLANIVPSHVVMHHIISKHCSFICCHASYYWQTLFLHVLSCIILLANIVPSHVVMHHIIDKHYSFICCHASLLAKIVRIINLLRNMATIYCLKSGIC